jgi:hypothetical protein
MINNKLSIKSMKKSELKQFINIGFHDDDDLINYYDESCVVNKPEDMVNNTDDKLKEYPIYFKNTKAYKVVYQDEPVGFLYMVNDPNILVSFALNKEFRTKENLVHLFDLIKMKMDNNFVCMLFRINSRAINWLKKCGMEVCEEFESIVKLKYSLCH